MAYDGADRRLRPAWRWAMSTEEYNARYGLTREEQDAFSAQSHQRAAAAAEERRLRRGDRAGRDPAAQGRPARLRRRTRASARDTTAESLGQLRPAFAKDGTITAGSSSQISDGAARRGRDEQGQGRGARAAPGSPRSARTASWPARTPSLHEQPANAIKAALAKEGLAAVRPRPGRDQRGLRRGRHRRRTRDLGVSRRAGQRQRRRDRARPPDRHVRRPARPAPRPRAASGAAAASARPRCAAAAARATP